MNLYEKTKNLWPDGCNAMSLQWAQAIEKGIPALEEVSKKFNEPRPLRFYAAVSMASKTGCRHRVPTVRFSLRFHGQEVAEVVVGATPKLLVKEMHQKKNLKYFNCPTNKGTYLWDGADAKAFRKMFRDMEKTPGSFRGARSPEHSVESRFLIEMEKRSSRDKFAGTLSGVRHAGLSKYEYPFQCPVPVSANTGEPIKSVGHIDIIARRKVPRKGVRLSIWELKKPHTYKHAVQQAYIYAVAMVLMMRSDGGNVWFRNFKFGTRVPKKLNLEAVIAVTKDQRARVIKDYRKLVQSNPLKLETEQATISLHAALYDKDTLGIEWLDLSIE